MRVYLSGYREGKTQYSGSSIDVEALASRLRGLSLDRVVLVVEAEPRELSKLNELLPILAECSSSL